VANFLAGHPKVACVHYPPLLPADHPTQKLRERQSSSAGSTFSFDVKGDQVDAFAFLNRLQVFKLAVSLGGTVSLICHPTTTVHSGLTEQARREIGITPSLVRMSIGIEHPVDLIADISQAFAQLEYGNRSFGIICVDQTEERRRWSESDLAYLDQSVLGFLSPIMALSRSGQ
jgi:methionine-gamma-lyase